MPWKKKGCGLDVETKCGRAARHRGFALAEGGMSFMLAGLRGSAVFDRTRVSDFDRVPAAAHRGVPVAGDWDAWVPCAVAARLWTHGASDRGRRLRALRQVFA